MFSCMLWYKTEFLHAKLLTTNPPHPRHITAAFACDPRRVCLPHIIFHFPWKVNFSAWQKQNLLPATCVHLCAPSMSPPMFFHKQTADRIQNRKYHKFFVNKTEIFLNDFPNSDLFFKGLGRSMIDRK